MDFLRLAPPLRPVAATLFIPISSHAMAGTSRLLENTNRVGRSGPLHMGSSFGPWRADRMIMRPISILGILLIIFGVFVLSSEGISYTKTEKILDVGPIEATAKHRKTIPISPIAGGAAVAAGVVLVITGSRRP